MNLNQVILNELTGLYGSTIIQEMNEIIDYYEAYEAEDNFTNFISSGEHQDYTPTKKKVNLIKKLIKEEARFLFGKTPTFSIKEINENDKDKAEELNRFISKVLKYNLFDDKLIKGARDCFIGKRVALKLNANTDRKKIKIMFIRSLEFVYETYDDDIDEIQKIIFFYQLNNESDKTKQKIWKQKYEMIEGKCLLSEGVFNGYGRPIDEEEHIKGKDLKLSGIPAYVIMNDGLSNDFTGESDVKELVSMAKEYNLLSSEDIDAIRKAMNRIIWGRDVEGDAIDSFQLKPGAFWDVKTSTAAPDGAHAELGTIDSDLNYGEHLNSSLSRTKTEMYEQLNIPQITNEDLKGFMTSGKSMKALYWQLITRCEEKMKAWIPALEWLVAAILEMAKVYNIESLPELADFDIEVVNNYPLQEDEDEEKTLDLQEVNAQTMSRKRYIQKWRNSTEKVADEELLQIQKEKQMLEDSFEQFDIEGGVDE